MNIGYARVSTREQNLNRQIDELRRAGIERIYSDKISGIKENRPELDKMLSALRPGDTVTICSYDRLARSTMQLFELAGRFEQSGVSLVSLKERTDTSTPQGRLFFTMCAAMAQFERELIKERQAEGIAAAKARGVTWGRRPTDAVAMNKAVKMYESCALSVNDICKTTGVSRSALYREVKSSGIKRHRYDDR